MGGWRVASQSRRIWRFSGRLDSRRHCTPCREFDAEPHVSIPGACRSPDGKSIVVKRQQQQTGEVAHDLVIRSLETGEEKFYSSSLGASVLADTGQPSLWFHNGESLLDFGGSACEGRCFLRTPVGGSNSPPAINSTKNLFNSSKLT